ncbi:MAG: acyltransferase domain-containing protein, partial [Nannocystaceae bacterium]
MPHDPPAISASVINSWIRERVAGLLGLDPAVVRDDEAVTRYGLDSARATQLIAELGRWLGRSISPVVAFEHPTIGALSKHLATPADATRPRPRPQPAAAAGDEPIAVVGLACRFPGGADQRSLWQSLCAGRHTVQQVGDSRWSVSRYHCDDAVSPGRAHTRWASLLDDEQLARFDPLFFNISPREAEEIDPQQRVFLELSWEALQDAGLCPYDISGSRTGVFAGVIWQDYGQLAERDPAAISMHTATGKSRGMVANRVSYTFGLQGPSVSVDTACSSSLVAVHLGCQSLLSGDSELVIAGGINLLLDPITMVGLSKFGGLSVGSMCRAFDAEADGFVRGEGGGTVVLKRLSRAIADGDRVYAVIRGSAINNDGASNGLTAPNPAAQQDVLERAWTRAGIDPGAVDYVETHGTGTVLGDPIEAKALGTVLGGERRPSDHPLRIGSIKTNIGHLEAAAGIAGFIKTVLSLHHGMLPPSLHVERLNPYIPFEELRLQVQTEAQPWPLREPGAPKRAGVSAFGWGGTNCHVALESVSRPAVVRQWRLAGTDDASLRAAAAAWQTEQGEPTEVGEGPLRIAITTADPDARPELLEAAIEGRARPEVARGRVEARPRVAFVCSPQGGQWRTMARSLLVQQPVFRDAIHEIHEAYGAHASWSLVDALTRDDASWAWERVHTIQPMIVAVQVGIAAVWRSWGITPDLYVGHSLGEVTAAHLAGALELEELARLAIHYSRLQATTDSRGRMAIVGLSLAAATERIEGAAGVVVAGHNGPRSVVLSGAVEDLQPLLEQMQAEGNFARFVDVNVAAHSPWIDPIMDELRRELEPLRPRRTHTPIISTLWGRELTGLELGADYWPQNLRQPVKFAEAVQVLVDRGVTAFVELNPHPILVPSIRQLLEAQGSKALVIESTRRGEDETRAMLEGLGRLFVTGHDASGRRRYQAARGRTRAVVDDPAALVAGASTAVPLSGRSEGGLRALVEDLRSRCAAAPELALPDVARGLASCDGAFSYRRVAVLDAAQPAAAAFASQSPETIQGQVDPQRRRKVVFVCPGQGSQWRGMARDLLASQPRFYEEIARIDRVAARYLKRSLIDELLDPEPDPWPIDVVQPLLFAVEVALGTLWKSWGIEPDAVVGHSMGEVAAYHLAGAVSLEHAVAVICLRSGLLARTSGQGAMLAIELSVAQARELVVGHEQQVSIAVDNSPTSTVLSGDAEVLEGIRAELDARGVFCRFVKVDVASHSPQMDPLLEELRGLLGGVSSQPGEIPVYSTVRGAPVDGRGVDASYWVDNLRQTVRFAESIEQLIADGHDLFIELSPHPILLTAVEQVIDASIDGSADPAPEALGSMRRNEPAMRVMLEGAARAYVLGHQPRWSKIISGGSTPALVG